MKITPEHYEILRNELKKFTAKDLEQHKNLLLKQGKFKDLEKRLRWDLFWGCHLGNFIKDKIYLYANDSHIDTALKRIVKEIREENK